MLSLKIAFRYLFSKKTTNAINIISGVSMLGMGVGAFALIVVLSVFNGFEGLVTSLYNSFYPDIEITAAKGKSFTDDAQFQIKIQSIQSIAAFSKTLEENAYLKYGEKDYIGTIKGVDENYNKVSAVEKQVKEGAFLLKDSVLNYAVIGANIFSALNINIEQGILPLQITVPKKGTATVLMAEDAFTIREVVPSGVFSIQQEFDSKYVFVSLDLAQELTGEGSQLSAYEIKLKEGVNAESEKEKIQQLVENGFLVKTRYEQKQTLYRVMKMERWAVYAILSFIMLIISFNIVGSLSMLVIEKTRDISILKTMGADNKMIQQVFLLEGVLSATIGAGIGIFLGFILCLLQLKYGFIKLSNGDNSFVVQSYPVVLKFGDFLLTFFTVIFIAFVASYIPAKRASESVLKFKE